MSRGANACRSSSRSIGIRTGSLSPGIRANATTKTRKHEAILGFLRGFVTSWLHLVWRAILGGHDRGDPAADREIADDGEAAWLERGDEVVEDLVGDVLVEDAAIAELDDVVLERLQLDAARVGDVGDADLAEVGQAGLRAQRGELRTLNRDFVVALGPRIGKGLDRRA